MSTFTSAWPKHPRRINIDERAAGVNIFISDPLWDDEYRITIAPTDAPALALAILEAAGLTVAKGDVKQYSFEDLMIDASLHLKCAIRLQERATAEAKAQAELEAEALELFNAAREEIAMGTYGAYEQLDNHSRRKWLAVARKSRELSGSK